jgi:gas vesicle protein
VDRARLRTFLLGGAAGLLAGILVAPRSGRELRGSLADRAGEARERGRESYFEAREGVRERRAAAREGTRPPGPAPRSPSEETTTEVPRPRLRDVSSGVEDPIEDPIEDPGEAERSEELRRKVRETRERLRGRQDLGQGPEA